MAGRYNGGGHTEKDVIFDVGGVGERLGDSECSAGFGIRLAVGGPAQVIGYLGDVQAGLYGGKVGGEAAIRPWRAH